jgi:hypothetical protein
MEVRPVSSTALAAACAASLLILVLAVYLPRHRRRDMATSYLEVGVGVLACSLVLSGSSVAAGLGLGLFGVLSIIRLRSEELSQIEVAYYFAALVVGLIGGLGASAGGYLPLVLMGAVVAVVAIADSRLLGARQQRRLVLLDRAYVDPDDLRAAVEDLLGTAVGEVRLDRLDLVQDSTLVTVTTTTSPARERVAR